MECKIRLWQFSYDDNDWWIDECNLIFSARVGGVRMVEMVVPSQVMLGERAVLECRCSVGIHHHSSSHHLQNHHNCKDRGKHKHKRAILERSCRYRIVVILLLPSSSSLSCSERGPSWSVGAGYIVIAVSEAHKQIAINYVLLMILAQTLSYGIIIILIQVWHGGWGAVQCEVVQGGPWVLQIHPWR